MAKKRGRPIDRELIAARLIFLRNEIERNPRISLKVLGEMCGVTRERIRQILKAEGIEKSDARGNPGFCEEGHPLPESRSNIAGGQSKKRCFTCLPLKSYQWLDPDTGHIRSRKHIYKITCYACGKKKTFVDQQALSRKRYDEHRKNPDMLFCSQKCLLTVTGKKWGWGQKWSDPTYGSKTDLIHGSCEICGKHTSQTRAKKQYREDPTLAKAYKNKHMFCSRDCMQIFRRRQSIQTLTNYIETNTTPKIKRTSSGNWSASLRLRSIPQDKKDPWGGRTETFKGKTRLEVHKKIMLAIHKDLQYRTAEDKE